MVWEWLLIILLKSSIAIIISRVGRGRLDSTNIYYTRHGGCNVVLSHTDILGDTLPSTLKKAGIIKPNVPVVIE
jgi:folylpolyglutamate synthase/dihydropteroate synthase